MLSEAGTAIIFILVIAKRLAINNFMSEGNERDLFCLYHFKFGILVKLFHEYLT